MLSSADYFYFHHKLQMIDGHAIIPINSGEDFTILGVIITNNLVEILKLLMSIAVCEESIKKIE